MSSLRSRARRIAFGDSNENLSGSDRGSSRSSSRSSHNSHFSSHNVFRHTSSMSEPCTCNSNSTTNKSSGIHSDKPIHIQPKRTNHVRKIHRSQPFELFVEALEQDGCVVVQEFVQPQISAQVQSAETVNLESTTEEDNRGRELPLDLNGLIRDSLLSDSLYQILSTHFLTLETLSYASKNLNLSVSKPILFSSTTTDLNLSTASTVQSSQFHRSDTPLHTRHSASPKYDYQSRRDTTLGLLVPELDSLSSNIPIRVIPGSHLWDDQKPDITRGVKSVHLHAGEAMILLGSLYHAVGEEEQGERPAISRSSTGSGSSKEKLLHDMWMCSGIYRPREQIVVEDEDEEA